MAEQHYRLTLNDAIAQYEAKLITATALMYFYIRIKRAQGWKITLYQKQTCEELGIKKSAFYKAIAKLLEKGLIDTENSSGVTVTVTNPHFAENIPQNEESIPHFAEKSPQIAENIPQIAEPIPHFAENETPENAQGKEHSNSPYSLTDSYQIFNNSLSPEERENFKKFGIKKAENLPNPPTLPQKWIEKHWEELKDNWYKETGKSGSTATSDWENDPRKDEWLKEINSLESPLWFYAPNDKLDKEKHSFFKWACDRGLRNKKYE